MTLQGAIQELYEMREDTSLPVYYALVLNDVINTLRTDVAEVRHGRWEPYLNKGLIVKCSVCGSRYVEPWNYCPNCGAKMDEVEDNG